MTKVDPSVLNNPSAVKTQHKLEKPVDPVAASVEKAHDPTGAILENNLKVNEALAKDKVTSITNENYKNFVETKHGVDENAIDPNEEIAGNIIHPTSGEPLSSKLVKVKQVLRIHSSDSLSADKAFKEIKQILGL